MALFGKRKTEFPIAQNLLESSYADDLVQDCTNTYDDLVNEGVAPSLLPMPIRQVHEASRFIELIINGGNGFEKYTMEENWDVERVAIALACLDALDLKDMADRLRPFVNQISATANDPLQFDIIVRNSWNEFAGEHLKAIERAWIFDSHFMTKAKAYLLKNVALHVVPTNADGVVTKAVFDKVVSRYKAGLRE